MWDKAKQEIAKQKIWNKMQEMKRQLRAADFEVTSPDGSVKITMNAGQQVKSVRFQGEISAARKSSLEQAAKEAYGKAIAQSQYIAWQKIKQAAGRGFPG